MNQLRMILTCLIIMSTCGAAFSYYFDTGIITFVQPNGVEFRGRQWGDDGPCQGE